MTAWEELVFVLLSVYLLSVAWLALDILFGRSRGAARLRAEGVSTGGLLLMSAAWPIMMVGPWLTWVVMETCEAIRTLHAVAVVAWEEFSERM